MELLEALKEKLRAKGAGIHISEIHMTELPHVAPTLPAKLIFAIANQDKSLRVNQAQYIYLNEWGGSRRTSLVEAVTAILRNASSALSLNDIHDEAERRMQRVCDIHFVLNCLKAMDATLDEQTDLWSKPSAAPESDDDDADTLSPVEQIVARA